MEPRVFISYASADRAWAEWVAWQLTDAGCTTFLDVRDLAAGQHRRTSLEQALGAADVIVALASADRRESVWAATEVPVGKPVVPVRLDDAPLPAELAGFQAVGVAGVDEAEARDRLVRAVLGAAPTKSAPSTAHLAGERRLRRLALAGPRLPGSRPRVWNVPPRNPGFAGRDDTLARLRDSLTLDSPVVLTGLGGVGKTQLALEYAHRFAGEYELVWWIRRGLIAEELAELAVRTGAAAPGTPVADARQPLKAELRARSRWLLIFDDPGSPEELLPHLPGGVGHVLITSRDSSLPGVAGEFRVGTFTRDESDALLRSALPSLNATERDAMATALDDLPLALSQAAASLRDGVLSVREYLERLNFRPDTDRLLSSTVASTVELSLELLSRNGFPAATGFLFGCALLAPAPFPLGPVTHRVRALPAALADALPPPGELSEMLGELDSLALIQFRDGLLRLHPLTHSVLRNLLPDSERRTAARVAEALLVSAVPDDELDPAAVQRWTELQPHLLAVDPADLVTEEARYALCSGCELITDRGDAATARSRLEQLFRSWSSALGDFHPDTLLAATLLVRASERTGDMPGARDLLTEVLHRRRMVLGEDHPETLRTAALLGGLLDEGGDPEQARSIAEYTLSRMRRVLGEDHPETLTAAADLATILQHLDDTDGAVRLVEEVLVRRRRTLGEDHPDSLTAAADLAALQASLGATETARRLAEEVLVRRRRALGEQHPDTQSTAALLVTLLKELGEQDSARALVPYLSSASADAMGMEGTGGPQGRAGVGLREATTAMRRRNGATSRDVHAERRRTSVWPAAARPAVDTSSVLVSHAAADEAWAMWAAENLENSGRRVDLHQVGGPQDAPWWTADRSVGVVLALVSAAYVSGTGLGSLTEPGRLRLLDALDRRHLVPVLLEWAGPELPPLMRERAVGPPLQDLDEQAALDLVQYAVRSPHRPIAERRFPGSSAEPSSDQVLLRQLANALLEVPAISDSGSRETLLQLVGEQISGSVRRSPVIRTDVLQIVRACMAQRGGLAALLDAVQLLEGDSAAVREVQRVVYRIQHLREAM
ncbi:FxSxx-COOH system tetratricopeptide repeat protein [Streptomyces bungoensis]